MRIGGVTLSLAQAILFIERAIGWKPVSNGDWVKFSNRQNVPIFECATAE